MWKSIIAITAIIAIAQLMYFAMRLGFDGVALAGSVAAIAAIGGYVVPHKKKKE